VRKVTHNARIVFDEDQVNPIRHANGVDAQSATSCQAQFSDYGATASGNQFKPKDHLQWR
jgi:hypothetical protein